MKAETYASALRSLSQNLRMTQGKTQEQITKQSICYARKISYSSFCSPLEQDWSGCSTVEVAAPSSLAFPFFIFLLQPIFSKIKESNNLMYKQYLKKEVFVW